MQNWVPFNELSDREKAERFKKIMTDPIEFLRGAKTIDQVDKKNPIKPFPVHLEYIQLFIRIWEEEDRLLIPKSRRMKMSWINIGLFLWDTMFHIGRHNAFVSKKEDDADDLVKRAKILLENYDDTWFPKSEFPKWNYTFCRLDFPELSSKIEAFAHGADQLRAYTLSGIMADEMAFWEKAEDMYSASVPTLEGGGKFVGISSPGPGFFKRLVFDQLEQTEGDESVSAELTRAERHFPLEGVTVWRNPKNKFIVIELHYTADPAKRTPEFKAYIKSSVSKKKYMQEYELAWESFAGLAVYPEFDPSMHLSEKMLDPELGLPLLRGWDFGLTPACIVAQVQGKKLIILHEFTEMNMGIDRFSDKVLAECKVLFPQWRDADKDWVDFIDPAGFFRKDTDEKTCAGIMVGKGMVRVIPGPVGFDERKESVEHWLGKFDRTGALFLLNKKTCPVLASGFNGGYRYPDKVIDVEPTKLRPIKDNHSHPHDALQYICSRVANLQSLSHIVEVPEMSYGFQKKEVTHAR
jgi:hypothetical protein